MCDAPSLTRARAQQKRLIEQSRKSVAEREKRRREMSLIVPGPRALLEGGADDDGLTSSGNLPEMTPEEDAAAEEEVRSIHRLLTQDVPVRTHAHAAHFCTA